MITLLTKLHARYDRIENQHLRCIAMILMLSPGFVLMGLSEIYGNPQLYHIGFSFVCLMGVFRIMYVKWIAPKGEYDGN